MIYKFKSPAAGDLIMLGPQGDQLLRLLGREPAAQGVIEPADMPAALQLLQAAVAAAEAPTNAPTNAPAADGAGPDAPPPAVGLRQRLWPMVEMLRRAHAAEARIVWGV
jgi:hypothetical protein